MKLAEKLQDYSFKLEYIQGAKNEVADALSRNPITDPTGEDINIDNWSVNLQEKTFAQ